MTDQLRDVLTRMAERAEPPASDPTLWSRARRLRRRRCVVAASAVRRSPCSRWSPAVGVVGAAGSTGPSRPVAEPHRAGHPVDRPRRGRRRRTPPRTRPGRRRRLRRDRQPDRRVRRHRRRRRATTGSTCPASTPSCLRRREVRRTGMVGLSLSPDGLELAYGWHAPLPDETGQEHGFVPSGVRILDLQTGRIRGRARGPPASGRVRRAAIGYQGFPWGRVPYGLRWSPTAATSPTTWCGRPRHVEGQRGRHWGDGPRRGLRPRQLGRRHVGVRHRHGAALRRRARPGSTATSRFWLSSFWRGRLAADGRSTTAPSREVDVNNTLATGVAGRTLTPCRTCPAGPPTTTYTVGLVRRSRRVLPRDPGPEQPPAGRRPPHRRASSG